METVSHLAATISALVVTGTYRYLRTQADEARRMRQAGVLKEAYEYIRLTHADRLIVYEHASRFKQVNTVRRLNTFQRAFPEVTSAVHSVANCYRYAGFLIERGLVEPENAFLDEAGHTLVRVYDILRGDIRCERLKIDKAKYKR